MISMGEKNGKEFNKKKKKKEMGEVLQMVQSRVAVWRGCGALQVGPTEKHHFLMLFALVWCQMLLGAESDGSIRTGLFII